MKFLLYYILRRFFVKTELGADKLVLSKGLIIRRISVIPKASVVRLTVRRTPIMRLFRAKEAEISTLGGSVSFYMRADEQLPFFGAETYTAPRAYSLGSVLFAAFTDTRALGGAVLFSAALGRVSSLFGSEYSARVMSALSDTADNVSSALAALSIFIPRVVTAAAVFASVSWLLAFARRASELLRFRVSRGSNTVRVSSGLFTLYEHTLVPDDAAFVCESTFLTLLCGRGVIRLRGAAVCPAARCRYRRRYALRPRSFLSGCAVPLTLSGIFCVSLVLTYLLPAFRPRGLLRIILWCGVIASAYSVIVCLVCTACSGMTVSGGRVRITARRSLRLYTAVSPESAVCARSLSRFAFSPFSAYTVSLRDGTRLRLSGIIWK